MQAGGTIAAKFAYVANYYCNLVSVYSMGHERAAGELRLRSYCPLSR